jgi:hypothetical protein
LSSDLLADLWVNKFFGIAEKAAKDGSSCPNLVLDAVTFFAFRLIGVLFNSILLCHIS